MGVFSGAEKFAAAIFYLQLKLFSVNFFWAIRETEAVIRAIQ